MKISTVCHCQAILDVSQSAFADGKYLLAEQGFLAALRAAEVEHGAVSTEASIISLNFADFLTQIGRANEIRPLLRAVCDSLVNRTIPIYAPPNSNQLNLGH